MNIDLLKHQYEFCSDNETRHLALIGGYGSGKTKAFCYKTVLMASQNVGHRAAILEPTYNMVFNTLIPEFDNVLDELEIPYSFKGSPTPRYVLEFEHGETQILCLGAENYKRLSGLNLAFAGVDEIDTITNKEIAWRAWRMLQSRLRAGKVYQLYTTSTPEGFGFLYEFFVEKKNDSSRIIHASTYDNPFLDKDFIQTLLDSYPSQLIEAYLEGKFVNLTSGQVYYSFDRNLNHTDATLNDFPNYVLHIGMDFNVNKMSAIIHVVKDGRPYAVDEIVGAKNTEHIIDIINDRYKNRKIVIYPDASGKAVKSNASTSDIVMLRNAGFDVTANASNPRVKDRIASMNAALCTNKSERKYLINTKTCISYTKALEQQVYNKFGEPDKQHDMDHPPDAAGYFIHKVFPLVKPATIRTH